MTAKEKRFIIVSVGDTLGFGYNETELPILVQLGEAHEPDYLVMNRTGLLAFYFTSQSGLRKARFLIAAAEALMRGDSRFSGLKIGAAEGLLVGEFDWLGRVNTGGIGLLGDAINAAVKQKESPFAYRSTLASLANQLDVQIA